MRRSLRFFSSCSSSSFIVRFPIEQKVLACHTAQDHPFQPVQIVKTITAGLAHGAQERFPRILPHQAQQLPQGQRDHLAAPLFQPSYILGQLGRGRDDGLLFGMRIGTRRPLAARRPVLSQRDPLVLGFGDAPVRHQAAGVQLNLDLVLGLAHLHAAADPVHWNRDRKSTRLNSSHSQISYAVFCLKKKKKKKKIKRNKKTKTTNKKTTTKTTYK